MTTDMWKTRITLAMLNLTVVVLYEHTLRASFVRRQAGGAQQKCAGTVGRESKKTL